MAKRDLILAALEEGPKSPEQLMEVAEVNKAGLASQFTYLRLMGKFPRKLEDGLVHLVTKEEFEAAKASRGSGKESKPLTPAEKLDKAQKREARASSALDNAKKRAEANATDYNELNVTKCECELKMASILVGEAEVLVAESPAEEVPADVEEVPADEAVEATTTEDADELDPLA